MSKLGSKQTKEHIAARFAGFKNKNCVLCNVVFKPETPRSLRCKICMNPKCLDCGIPLGASGQLRRLRLHCERRCMTCYLVPSSRGERRKSILPIGTISNHWGGYRSVKTESGWMLEHRYNAEKKLGRKLSHGEVVHHIDGNPSNSLPENLAVCRTNREHLDKYHADDLKNPPKHHNGRRPKGSLGWKPIKREASNG